MNQYEYYFKEIREKNFDMSEVEFYFKRELKKANVQASDIAEDLGVSMPTLKSKIANPNKIDLRTLSVMKKRGIDINPFIKVIDLL